MRRNPRVIASVVLVAMFAISQGVEQATQGKYPTPALTAEVIKIGIVALSSAGVLAEIAQRILRGTGNGNGSNEPNKKIEPPEPQPQQEETKP